MSFSQESSRFVLYVLCGIGAVAVMIALFVGAVPHVPVMRFNEWMNQRITSIQALSRLPTPSAPTSSVMTVVDEESQVIRVVEQSAGAVVSIVASSEVPKLERCYGQHPLFDNVPPEFRGFFDTPSLCQNGTELQRTGAGSGFLVSADGYIVTNRHVVSQEQAQYTVVLNDEKHLGQKLTAKVVARHPSNDIAVLKVEAQDLPFLHFGDSAKLRVGQTAIAIGYALGEFDNTVSKGVISGLARSISAMDGQEAEQLRGLIQTDAAINPGNSGGPLLDIAGTVVGMNTAVANAQNIGFAIPANGIRAAFEQARSSGTITEPIRPFFGVRYVPVTEHMQQSNHLPYGYGVLVARGNDPADLAVIPGSPADKAGIQENDILLEVDGKQLNERYDLIAALESKKPGDVVIVKVFHKGKEEILKVTLEKKG